MRNTKVQWLCLIRNGDGAAPREEQWVRGVLRPYRDGVKQVAQNNTLVFFSTIQVEVLLKELPQWQNSSESRSTWVGVDTEYAQDLGVSTEEYSWLLINTASNYTTGTRFNKYYGFTAATGTVQPNDIAPPQVTMPDVISLEQAEDNLRSMLTVLDVTIQKYD